LWPKATVRSLCPVLRRLCLLPRYNALFKRHEKVQRELDSVVGTGRLPTPADSPPRPSRKLCLQSSWRAPVSMSASSLTTNGRFVLGMRHTTADDVYNGCNV